MICGPCRDGYSTLQYMEKLLSRVINFLGGMEDSPREILSRIGANFMVLSRAYGKPCTARHDPSPVRSSQDQSGITTSFFYGSFLGSKKLPISERCHPSLRARFPPGIFFRHSRGFFFPLNAASISWLFTAC